MLKEFVVPVFESERLRLRGHSLDDFENCAGLWSNPEVARYISPQPFTREESWSRLLRYAGHWTMLGFGYWVVEEKSSGAFLGEVGFADYRREMEPPLAAIPEAGWVFLPSAHGRGYATEAVRRVLEWGDSHFHSRRSACLIHPDNAPSIRVAEKCGYSPAQRAIYKGRPATIFIRD